MKTIDEMINENDNFKGTKKIETSYKKFRNLQTVAEKLQRFLDCEVKSEDPDDNTHRNCVLSVTCRYPMMLNNFNQRAALAELMLNTDDVVVTANPQKKTIRYSFGVRGIWE
jgi:hypothetical protein